MSQALFGQRQQYKRAASAGHWLSRILLSDYFVLYLTIAYFLGVAVFFPALMEPRLWPALALVLVSIIVLKVVPAFLDFYATFGADLPVVTKIIVRVSEFIRSQFVLLLVAIAIAVTAILGWVRQAGQKARFDRLVLGISRLAGWLV